MPACDGSKCTTQIPWRITPTALQMTGGNVAFSVDDAHAALLTVLAKAKCWNLAPAKKTVVFKSLCKACWDRQAAVWGDVATYTTARAKTVAEGIYMQVARPDFEVQGRYDKQAILSCAAHELMHYWSNASLGLQNYNRRANVDWDEAVADVLGLGVYEHMYRGKDGFTSYITPYNTYCKYPARAKTAFGNVFGRLWREQTNRARLPKVVADFIASSQSQQPAKTMVETKDPAATRLVKVLNEYLFTWFFQGPTAWIDNGGSNVQIDRFLDNNNLSNMFAVSNVFQAYDGNNTLHAI